MHQYIVDTAFAAQGLIGLVNHGTQELEELAEKQKTAAGKEAYFDFAFMHREMDSTANYWHGRYHEAYQERVAIDEQVKFLEAQILDKRTSLEALAAALLQLAKQGISSVRGAPANCPTGRKVRGVALKSVVWAGRNQSQHYEEPRKINENTESVFTELNSFDTAAAPLDPKDKNNHAFSIVKLLGWKNYEQYEQDMVSLLG
jgi:hypothetical protein